MKLCALWAKGTFGAVYACRDHTLADTMVAIKVFSQRARKLPGSDAQLAQEMLAAHSVQHHNVVRFYDLIRTDDMVAIVMEYVSGPQLTKLINPHWRCAPARVLELMQKICAGLEAIHACGIVHRDLKRRIFCWRMARSRR